MIEGVLRTPRSGTRAVDAALERTGRDLTEVSRPRRPKAGEE